MADFFQFLIAGLSQGAIYALIAIGFSVIYRATRIVNFAQGEFVMMGGLGAAGALSFGLSPLLAAAVTVLTVVAAAFLLHRVLLRLAKSAPITLIIIVTIGASIALRGAAQIAWGRSYHSLPSLVGAEPFRFGGVTILPQVVLILAVTGFLVAGLDMLFRRTRFGKAMVAAAINPRAATLVGIELTHVHAAAFVIAGILGAVAGLLITPLAMVQFESGLMFGLKGFAAAVLGGLGSLYGVVAGGLFLGIVEALGAGYFSSAYKDVIAFILIVGVLLTKPEGLFGRMTEGRV
jgi:branched-chain amino acid transport system permease protein